MLLQKMLKKLLTTVGAVILLLGCVYLASKYHVKRNTLRRFTNSIGSTGENNAPSSPLEETKTENQLNKSSKISDVTALMSKIRANSSDNQTLKENTTIVIKNLTLQTIPNTSSMVINKTTNNSITVSSLISTTDKTTISSSIAATVNSLNTTKTSTSNPIIFVSSPPETTASPKNITHKSAVFTTEMATVDINATMKYNETLKVTAPGLKGFSPLLTAVVVIGCFLVFVVVIAVFLKLVKSCKEVRFRRLREMPMDDFDDYSEVYSEHTVPIRNPI